MAERDMEAIPGSWETSGTESQRIMRFEPPLVTATQMLEDSASAPAESGADELFDTVLLGRAANWACPE
jgi:hypothetical protein